MIGDLEGGILRDFWGRKSERWLLHCLIRGGVVQRERFLAVAIFRDGVGRWKTCLRDWGGGL